MKFRPVLAAGAIGSLIAVGSAVPAYAQDQNVDNVSQVGAEALAQALIGENIELVNHTYTGSDEASGMFSGFADAIGIDTGVVLTTGRADHQYSESGHITSQAVLFGPNNSNGTSNTMGTPGDADLDALVDAATEEAAVLEIDFIPEGDTVSFNYVFGSEEYPDYVGSNYNDVFAFFVNGENYATITGEDGSETFVSINNINEESNSSYFRANYYDSEEGSPINTGLNGLTTVLGFEAPVNAGEVNTLKLAIADVQDSIFDSAVMIQAGSFSSPVNTPPVADDLTIETDYQTPVDVTLAGSDEDGDDITFELADTESLEGTLEGEGANWTFTPAEEFSGTTTFTYTTNDGEYTSEPATVTITVAEPSNTAPEADNQNLATQTDTPLDLELVATDAQDDDLTYTVDTEGLDGTLEGDGANWTFTPAEGFEGQTSFTFTANDGELDSNVATVTIHVNADGVVPNIAPVVEDQAVETEFNTPVELELTGTDEDGDELTYTVDTEGLEGTLEGDGANWTFTPAEGFAGTTSFTYLANDGQDDSNIGTVTITVAEEVTGEPEPTDTPEPTPTPTEEPTTPVEEDPADDEEELSKTGAWSAPLAIAGAFLVAAGAVLVYLRRRSAH